MADPNELVHPDLLAVARALEVHARITGMFAKRGIMSDPPKIEHYVGPTGWVARWGTCSRCRRGPLELEWTFRAVVNERYEHHGKSPFEPAVHVVINGGLSRPVAEAHYWGDKHRWYARPPTEAADRDSDDVREGFRPVNADDARAFVVIEQMIEAFLLGSGQRIG